MGVSLIAEREQFRSLSADKSAWADSHALRAKVRKIIQKIAFFEDINTIYVQNTVQFVKRSVILSKGTDPVIFVCLR